MWGIQDALGDAAGIRVCMEMKTGCIQMQRRDLPLWGNIGYNISKTTHVACMGIQTCCMEYEGMHPMCIHKRLWCILSRCEWKLCETGARPTGQATHLVDDIDAGSSRVVLHQHHRGVISTIDERQHQGGSPILDIELNSAISEYAREY